MKRINNIVFTMWDIKFRYKFLENHLKELLDNQKILQILNLFTKRSSLFQIENIFSISFASTATSSSVSLATYISS